MADDYGASVADLLPGHFDKLAETVAEHVEQEPGGLGRIALGAIQSRAAEQLRGVLAIDAFELIAKAWAAAREMHGYADSASHPKGRTETCYLGQHSLSAGVHPVLQITVAGMKLSPMRFTLLLSAQLRSAELSILDGAIVAAAPGDGSGTAVLKYRDIALHDPLPSRHIRLPMRRTFEPGLRIP